MATVAIEKLSGIFENSGAGWGLQETQGST